MTNFGPFARIVGAAGLAATLAGFAAPALAGQAEAALLKSYEGNWRGEGTAVGTDTERVTCRMALTPGNQDKVNYAGRCTLAGTNLSINGTLAYIDDSSRFEGAMTSNLNFSGVAVGKKQADGIVFNLQSRGQQDNTDLEINAAIVLSPGTITVQFKATDIKTGKVIIASVPFRKV
jgi:hypothetical protein